MYSPADQGPIGGPSSKTPFLIYIVGAVILLVLSTVALALNDWVTYCFYQFGLTKVWLKNGDDISGDTSTIGDLRDLLCTGELESVVDGFCPDFCSNILHMKHAGGAMLGLGIASILLLAGSGVIFALGFFGKHVNSLLATIVAMLPAVFWIAGLAVYIGISDFPAFDSTSNGATDLGFDGGFGLACAVAGLLIVLALLGMVFSRKFLNNQ